MAVHVLRGGLIGIAETIPGVSGGTIALVTGIYERIIAAGKAITDLPGAARGGDFSPALRRIDWKLLIPVAIGMLAAVFLLAGTMESFVTGQPVISKALFFGMIAVCIAIPLGEIRPGEIKTDKQRKQAWLVFGLFALATFILTSLPSSEISEPPLWLVFIAAAIAICALVLPGVSGSFFLLVIGMYAPTMAAVDQRNIGYLLVFMLGALTGIVLFVRLLERLLENHHALTLVAMSGLLLGSLRALWPWQGPEGQFEGFGDNVFGALLMALLGALIVGVVAAAQRYFSKR